jgi:hypothetical protein
MTKIKDKRFIKLLVIGLTGLLSIALIGSACEQASKTSVNTGNVAKNTEVAKAAEDSGKPILEYTADGQMKKPSASVYRKWIYLGTPVTPNDMNGGAAPFPDFHNVYMDPESFANFEKTGTYRDGTVIVKELASVGAKEASSGKGYFEGEFIGLEVTVKDAKRFKDEPGNWAYFSFGHKYPLAETIAKQPVASCNSCHSANAGGDFVFIKHYPVLRAAMPTK